jgi:DNA-binding transcriptional LysR family regulator
MLMGPDSEESMDTESLATFAAVARAGGITRAAQSLNTVQSNVTARIKHLEAELGRPLFRRHSRGITLTPAGAQLLPYAERIGHLLEEARRAATDDPLPKGKLQIGSMETTAALRLPDVLSAYAAACPQVDLVLQTGPTAQLVNDVLERRLEGALVAGPVEHPDLIADKVVEEELAIIAAPGIRSLSAAISADDTKILVFRAGCSYRIRLDRFLAERGVASIRRLELGTLEGIIGCVAAGMGISLLPKAVVETAAREKRVSVHTLRPQDAKVATVFIRRHDAFVSTALSRFLECAKAAQRGNGKMGPLRGRRGAIRRP